MATAFGISMDELYGDLTRCLRAASVAFETAPVRSSSTRPPRQRLPQSWSAIPLNRSVGKVPMFLVSRPRASAPR